MNTTDFLVLPILIPLFFGTVLTLRSDLSESKIIRLTAIAAGLHTVSFLLLVGIHFFSPAQAAVVWKLPVYSWKMYHFSISLFLDGIGGIFLGLTTFLFGVVVRFSHFYMQSEQGNQRFFSTLLFFLGGMSQIVLAADLDSLFLGWEIVGISSFLLIGFYSKREQSARNAVKIYSIYRLCDLGLLVGAYLEHSMLGNISFQGLSLPNSIIELQGLGEWRIFALSLLLLLSASGKSAQFPFSFWIASAMEGPTPSSAIFYGALSIHAGVFLLLRTYPIWHLSQAASWSIGILGALSALLSTGIGRVQSNFKSQVGYASVTQVGLMFIEISLGFTHLALFHLVSNACLRSYQLLVSNSVVAYRLQVQNTLSTATQASQFISKFSCFSIENLLPKALQATLYSFAISEGYLETALIHFFWRFPSNLANWIHKKRFLSLGTFLLATGLLAFIASPTVESFLIASMMGLSLWLTLGALHSGSQIMRSWLLSYSANMVLALAIALGSGTSLSGVMPFIMGISFWLLVGSWNISRSTLNSDSKFESHKKQRFSGYSEKHSAAARWAFLSFLGMSGFPISSAFFGEDMLLALALKIHPAVAFTFLGIFILNGIALVRSFVFHFWGSYREVPFDFSSHHRKIQTSESYVAENLSDVQTPKEYFHV